MEDKNKEMMKKLIAEKKQKSNSQGNDRNDTQGNEKRGLKRNGTPKGTGK
ncbi:MAG: hypothetical protein WCI30_09150 [Clostridia bacterium]